MSTSEACSKPDYSPVSWREYFDEMEDVSVGADDSRDVFRIYKAGNTGPLLVLLHGGGHSALSWAVFTRAISSKVNCRVLSMDLRGHGDTLVRQADDFSTQTMSSIKSGQIKNLESARVSMVGQIRRCEAEEAETLEQTIPVSDVVTERNEEFYDQSYVDDKENVASDEPQRRAGKFMMQVLPPCGHAVLEDKPEKGLRTHYADSFQGLKTHYADSFQGLRTYYDDSFQGLRTHYADSFRGLRTHYADSFQGLRIIMLTNFRVIGLIMLTHFRGYRTYYDDSFQGLRTHYADSFQGLKTHYADSFQGLRTYYDD
ncbi:hypothetical protein F7725_004985 [Dissostichus mawsoni]|uniref:protein phosphatase methylesterase-1 n=1 Tax=Dissostichus mawsoni TaxID=36200 RepID=A0A7J5XKN9_DISMA|nr:hypothetical protein F7725_004985 [Dissostichus mawsoni]